jgi:hypothetical protein
LWRSSVLLYQKAWVGQWNSFKLKQYTNRSIEVQ